MPYRFNPFTQKLDFFITQGSGLVDSVFGRVGDVVAGQDDYTWEQIDKANANIADMPLRSHNDLQDVGVNTHADIDTYIANNSIPVLNPGSVVFGDAEGKITDDTTNLTYDDTNKHLHIGEQTIIEELEYVGVGTAPISSGVNVDSYSEIYHQNRNSGSGASTDLVLGNDTDDGTVETGTYVDLGIASSGYDISGEEYIKPNDGYIGAYGGNLVVQVLTEDKKIAFATGGESQDEVRLTIADSQTTIYANKDPELAPTLETVNWDVTNGFSAGSGELVCINDIDDSTATPSDGFSVTAGKTYHVVIVISDSTGSIKYEIGGVEGTAITATTIAEYITANTTDKIIFTATAGATCTITSLSVRELVSDTGNLFVEGDIILGSRLSTTTGAGILSANGEGIATFVSIPLLPSFNPTTDNQAVRKGYVDTVVQGLYPTYNCRLATTIAGTLATSFEEGDTIDTKVLVAGDIILIKNQVDETENGFYTVQTSGAPLRTAPYETAGTMLRGTYTSVEDGDTNLKTSWVMYLPDAVIDTGSILFRQNYVSPPPYTGSDGILVTAFNITIDLSDNNPNLEIANGGLRILNDVTSLARTASGLAVVVDDASIQVGASGLEVVVDDFSIEIGANGLDVKDLGITNGMLEGSIANDKLLALDTAGLVEGGALTKLDEIPSVAGVIPLANLATGTPTGTKFIADDGTLKVPAGGGSGTVTSVNAGTNVSITGTATDPIVNSLPVGGVSNITVTGTIDDTNMTFTCASEPSNLVINGGFYAPTGGNITWSYATGTITLSSPVGTGGSIYGIESANSGFTGFRRIYVQPAEPVGASPGDIWLS